MYLHANLSDCLCGLCGGPFEREGVGIISIRVAGRGGGEVLDGCQTIEHGHMLIYERPSHKLRNGRSGCPMSTSVALDSFGHQQLQFVR